ncbi:MAG: hypothetical protein ACJ8AD_17640 [Gemmatimonadaceae bacterium]
MTRGILLALILVPVSVGAQEVVLREPGPGPAAEIVRRVVDGPHVVRAGQGPLEFPRDSTITTSLLVLGRPTYLASRVQGDVVVIGADLFLRPGADVSGRAVAIGGTVATTSLGRVAGGVESLRDETFVVHRDDAGARYTLDYQTDRADEREPLFSLTGLSGVQIPAYDRVDGSSLGVGAMLQLREHAVEVEPAATYRSRLGMVDPSLTLRVNPLGAQRLVVRAARETRTNDDWIYGELVNSALTFFAGVDTRNYFRSNLADARLTWRVEHRSYLLEPFIGGRFERISPIAAVGNVWSVTGRKSTERMGRPNPLVEAGDLSSALIGADFESQGDVTVNSRASITLEPGLKVPATTATFVQLTLHGAIDFSTFRTQRLHVKVHGVATRGDSVPMARFAYLGGSGTLRTLELLEQGGTALLYMENRYTIPLDAIVLPLGISPVLTLRDAFGAAGVGSLPALQHEVGVGIGLSALRLDVTRGVAGRKHTEVGIGISLSR